MNLFLFVLDLTVNVELIFKASFNLSNRTLASDKLIILRHDSSHYNIKIIIIYSGIFLLLINYLYFTFISANKLVLFIFSNHFIHLFCLTTLPYLNRKLFCPTISLFTTTAHAHIKFAYISEMVYFSLFFFALQCLQSVYRSE